MRAATLLAIFGGASFDPVSLQDKFAGWWQGEQATYITDKIGSQSREELTQNSLAGQKFPGRAIEFAGATNRALVQDNGALDIGSNSAYSLCFNIKWTSFTGFSRLIGKIVDASTAGEFYCSTGSNSLVFNVRGTGGLSSVNFLTASVDVWYNVILTIDSSQVIRCYVDNVAAGSTPTVSGTIPAIANTHGFGVNCSVTSIASPSGYGGTVQYRDIRIFKGKVLSSSERQDYYDGKWVTGFTQWWPLCDNSTTRLHSAKNGGLHLTATGISGSSLKTGYWRQPYNKYGYAENATYGQIPADLSGLSDVDGTPTIDCYGNALVFYGSAKQHLAKSGGNFTMYADASSTQLDYLIRACKQVSLNTWFSSSTPQAIAEASVATYCGSRQFYNATTKELIIIKFGESLTATEETNLMTYLGNPTIPTSYHADTTSYLARCAGSYTTKLKSRLDNLFRLLDSSGAKAEIETASVPCWGVEDDMGLDLYNATYNIIDALNGHVNYFEKRGLSPQDGCFENGFIPSSASKFLQNDACTFFKLSERQITPSLISIYGSNNVGTTGVYVRFTQETNGLNLNYWLNDAAGSLQLLPSGVYNNSAFLMNRTSSTVKNAFANGAKMGSTSLSSASRPTVEAGIGYARTATADGGITHQNYISAIGFGGSMSDAVSALFVDILDTFCDDQKALADEWFTTSDGIISGKNLPYQYMDISPDGTKRVWHDYYNIYYTTDGNGGHVATKSFAFNFKTLGWMHMGHLMDNGTFIWATNKNKAYRTTDFVSYSEMSLTKNGSPYSFHTPVSSINPGEPLKFIGAKRKMYLTGGEEIFMYAPYNFSARGAGEANIWCYREGYGNELKTLFEFGQNPYVTDNGSASSGTGGTPVGDPLVSYKIRHTHGLTQCNDNPLRFICTTGDLDRTGGGPLTFYECMWMEVLFDPNTDTATVTQIKQGTHTGLAKTTTLDMPPEYPGYGFFGGDSYELPPAFSSRGVFKQPLNDLANEGSIVQILSFEDHPGFESYMNSYFMIEGTKLMGSGLLQLDPVPFGLYSHAAIFYATDFNTEIKLELLKHPGNTFTYRMQRIGTGRYLVYKADDYDYSNGEQCYEFRFN